VDDVQALNELLSSLLLFKVGTAVLMVILLSVLAETVSTRFAGILSGYPLGAAISLYFIGYEMGPQFAAESALYTSIGLIATQVFAYCYYRSSLLAGKLNGGLQILYSALGGIGGYFLAASLLRPLPVNPAVAVVLPAISILVFIRLFRGVKDSRIERRAGANVKTLLLRAAFAACAIVCITSTAKVVGARWAGLFAAFPITMLPFVVIIHFSYDSEHVHAILKHVPQGLGSLVVYALSVSVFYPMSGIHAGTAIAYALATLYLLIVHLRTSLR
jgi:hypothetical protein